MVMEYNELLEKIQSFFDINTLTIVGSGLSCSEGISGMWGLSQQLKKYVPDKLSSSEEIECWEKVETDLNKGVDLESALQNNEVSNEVESAIMEVTYNLISKEDSSILEDILTKDRLLKFAEYLSCFNTELYNLVVITTNYDLLIEYACETKEVPYSDSFSGKILSKYAPEKSKHEMLLGVEHGKKPKNKYRSYVKLYKPHGSINWKQINQNIYRINNFNCGTPCIITPGSNKYEKGYDFPFDYHIGKMGQEIDKASKIIFIGYGFNDNHLETHLKTSKNINKPKLIITRSLSENAKKLVLEHRNIIAIESYEGGSKIFVGSEYFKVKDKNLWDISELIEEVF